MFVWVILGIIWSIIPDVSPVLPNYTPALIPSSINHSRDDLIRSYFLQMFSNMNITEILLIVHGIKVSISTVKRTLKRLHLQRRCKESSLGEIVSALLEEIAESGACIGYRQMWQRLKIIHCLHIKRSTIQKLLQLVDPDGVARRKKKRLMRRKYVVPGPNFIWHVDGYDKLKPFGFAIHGCCDGFSRKIIWLEIGPSNNNPKIIAKYYLNSVKQLQLVPRMLRCDAGTENTDLKLLQPFFRRNSTDSLAGINSFITGRSTSNQRIESWWSQLRKGNIDFWMGLFKDLRDKSEYNDDNPLHVECLRYCFMRLIRADLQKIAVLWNTHKIRKQKKNVDMIPGKPDLLYFVPESIGKVNYSVPIDQDDLLAVNQIYDYELSILGCSRNFEKVVMLLKGGTVSPKSVQAALALYKELIDRFTRF